MFGTVSINPFECIDLTPVQLRIIQSESEEMEVLVDQFPDVADLGGFCSLSFIARGN